MSTKLRNLWAEPKAVLTRVLLPLALALTLAACGGGGGDQPAEAPTPPPVSSDEASVISPDPASAVEINGSLSAPNLLLVRFRTGATEDDMADVIASAGGRIVGAVPLTMLVQAQFDGTWTEARASQLIDQLSGVPIVSGASLEELVVSNAAYPNDPWSPDPAVSGAVWDGSFLTGSNWNMKAIHADVAWELIYYSGREIHPVTMGVIDSGFVERHQDLKKLPVANLQLFQIGRASCRERV